MGLEKHTKGSNTKINFASFRELGLLIFVVLLSGAVQVRNYSFLTFENINDLLANASILAILSIGMMMVILTGGIDLSIGSNMALTGMVAALFISNNPSLHPLLAVLLGIVIGIACGAVVGLLVSRLNILPLIATLGMNNIFRGLTFLISKGAWVSAHQMSDPFKLISTGKIFGLNNLIFIAIAIFLGAQYFLNFTRTGRKIYAVGSNKEASLVSGISAANTLFMVYTLMGLLSGLAGVLWVSKYASAQPDTATGYEINVIAACVMGGVSIIGGSGKVIGVLLGALLIGIINNALPLINVSPFWQNAIQGFIILIAVITNTYVKRSLDWNNLLRRKI